MNRKYFIKLYVEICNSKSIKRLMKKLVLIIAILFCSFSVISAKKNVKKWIIVRDKGNKIVYLDTTTIRYSDGQLSLWSLVQYKKPKVFIMYQGKVSKIKSHLLFNTTENRFTVIGALYYDLRARIVGESTTPIISQTGKIISSPIIKDSDQDILFEKAKEFIITGKIARKVPKNILDEKPKGYLTKKYSEPEKVVKDTVVNPFADVPAEPVLTSDSTIIKNSIGGELRNELIKSEKVDTIVSQPVPVEKTAQEKLADSLGNDIGNSIKTELKNYQDSSTSKFETYIKSNDNTGETNEIVKPQNTSVVKTENKNVSELPIQKVLAKKEKSGTKYSDKVSYNADNETQITKNIWSDGDIFVIQLSSWRSKQKAESLVQKLKSKGNNAFVFEKYIPQKKRKYYRVRIGYFNSLSEAKSYLNTIK